MSTTKVITKLRGWKYVHNQIKTAFILYPEISYMALLNVLVMPFHFRKWYWEAQHPNCNIVVYKENYTIYRPDDPRSYRVKASPDLAPGDPHLMVT